MSKELYYETRRTKMPPLSVIYGVNVKVSELVRNLIDYYFPGARRLWDPTPGPRNYQFSPYLELRGCRWVLYGRIEYVASDIEERKWNCPCGSCLIVDVLKPPYPFEDGYFDVVVYDPPYLPWRPTSDSRSNHYFPGDGIDLDRVLNFYSSRVIKELARVSRQGVIVKGTDFYEPMLSDELYFFVHDVLDMNVVRLYFKPVALHIYRYFESKLHISRARIGRSIASRGFKRALVSHTYYLILKKPDS